MKPQSRKPTAQADNPFNSADSSEVTSRKPTTAGTRKPTAQADADNPFDDEEEQKNDPGVQEEGTEEEETEEQEEAAAPTKAPSRKPTTNPFGDDSD